MDRWLRLCDARRRLVQVEFLKYIPEFNIHVLDYSGRISYEDGLSRMEILDDYFNMHAAETSSIKLVLDLRKTMWETKATHDALSKMARQKFHPAHGRYRIYLAVVNNEFNYRISDTEQWFIEKEMAIQWLKSLPKEHDIS